MSDIIGQPRTNTTSRRHTHRFHASEDRANKYNSYVIALHSILIDYIIIIQSLNVLTWVDNLLYIQDIQNPGSEAQPKPSMQRFVLEDSMEQSNSSTCPCCERV